MSNTQHYTLAYENGLWKRYLFLWCSIIWLFLWYSKEYDYFSKSLLLKTDLTFFILVKKIFHPLDVLGQFCLVCVFFLIWVKKSNEVLNMHSCVMQECYFSSNTKKKSFRLYVRKGIRKYIFFFHISFCKLPNNDREGVCISFSFFLFSQEWNGIGYAAFFFYCRTHALVLIRDFLIHFFFSLSPPLSLSFQRNVEVVLVSTINTRSCCPQPGIIHRIGADVTQHLPPVRVVFKQRVWRRIVGCEQLPFKVINAKEYRYLKWLR